MDGGKIVMPSGAVEGQNIRPLFQKLFGNYPTPLDFDTLPIPFRAVTADLETGEAYVPKVGDLATIVRASMSVPGAFAPVEVENHLLVDGGIVNNLPVDVTIAMGADVLIVVDLQSDLAKRDALKDPLSISGQMVSLLLTQNSLHSRTLVRPQDIVLEPNVNGYTVTDFPKGMALAAIGEATALKSVDQLKRLSVSPEEYARYQAQRTSRPSGEKRLAFVRINNNSEFAGGRLLNRINVKAGDVFDADKVESDMQELYQTGYFKSAQYTLVEENGETGLQIDLKEKDWLNNFTRFGLSLEDNFEGDDRFRMGAAYRENNLFSNNGYGEVQFEIGKTPRLGVELLEYLSPDSSYFFAPSASIGRSSLYLQQDGQDVAEYSRSEVGGSLMFGRKLGTSGEATVGYSRFHGRLTREIGQPDLPELSYNTGDLTAGFALDTRDNPDFPTEGFSLGTQYRSAIESLGSDNGFEEVIGRVVKPLTFGVNTVALATTYGVTMGNRPIERDFTLGGFTQISGYQQNALVASDFIIGQVIAYRRFSEIENPFFNLAFYGGASFELSHLINDGVQIAEDQSITSGSIFVGADTPLFPVYFGYGRANTQESSFYIIFGRLSRSIP